MREILFRGKRVDTGEWVYGSLVRHKHTSDSPAPDEYHIVQVLVTSPGDLIEDSYPVVTETVGQYTGLKDKDGRKIFEGDVVHYELAHMSESGYPYKDAKYNHPKVGPVVFTDQCFLPLAYCVEDRILISGNIHDNPELLGVK